MQDIGALHPAEASAREKARVQFLPKTCEVHVRQAEDAVRPETLAHETPDDSIGRRQLVCEQDMFASDSGLSREVFLEKLVEGAQAQDATVDEGHPKPLALVGRS
jgi:hypothetical protein